MYACFNPFMADYHFIPPTQRQYYGGLGCFGAFSFAMPFVGASVFAFNTPYMNYYNPYAMSAFNPFFMPTYYGYNAGLSFNYNFNYNMNTNTTPTPRVEYTPSENIQRIRQQRTVRTRHFEGADNDPVPAKGRVKANAKKLGPQFVEKVKQIAQRINCNYQDLIAVMISESGLNPQAVNITSKATGLIQFMPSTAKAMGTTVEQIKKMSAEEQLVLVEKYLTERKRSAGFSANHKLSAGELYALVFLPARSNREVLCSRGETNSHGRKLRYYECNRGLDTNKDGKITKTELDNRIVGKRISDSSFS